MTTPEAKDSTVAEWRKARRAALLAQREAVPEETRRALNETITAHLVAGFPELRGMIVGLYWPFRGEFDPRFAIRHFRGLGGRAALPQVVEKRKPLRFLEWWPGVDLDTSGVYGLPVPIGTDAVTPNALLIPPIGFDAQGYRLGYGGGYFDRTLASLDPQPLKIGVGFEISRIETIRPQPHDIPMDFIVTEAGIHRVGPEGLQRVRA